MNFLTGLKLFLKSGRARGLHLLSKTRSLGSRKLYWDLRAKEIHEKWGWGQNDYPTLRRVLEMVKPLRLLDVGCGSGRTFGLYLEMQIPEVVGQDISAKALSICRERFPNLPYALFHGPIDDLAYEENYFDLIVSTRVLSAIHPAEIDLSLRTLCGFGRNVYLNEMTDSDYTGPSDYWFKHDYLALMAINNFSIMKKGAITTVEFGKTYLQTWFLYTKGRP